AALATGMGSRTSVGASLLLGIANFRLGYWWDSGIDPGSRPGNAKPYGVTLRIFGVLREIIPVYGLLADELIAQFPGTSSRYWYLSDGGHFDNTGCYELVRRRIPFIVCVDNGADAEYECSDLATLTRAVRVDFGAEIQLLDSAALDAVVGDERRSYFGTFDELKSVAVRPKDMRPRHYPRATLARIRYATEAWPQAPMESLMLIVKPTVCGGEPLDVSHYRKLHPDFPQETTAQQFFDDAQWEAYRRLGEHIGECLFASSGSAENESKWDPTATEVQTALTILGDRDKSLSLTLQGL
ncbi:MAG: hypothetical protein ACHREM_12905, partial [Polyangiales bacterium]